MLLPSHLNFIPWKFLDDAVLQPVLLHPSCAIIGHIIFIPVLLRYNWQTALYKFKVYNIMIWLTSWNDCHDKFNKHPSSHIDNKIKEIEKSFLCDEKS